MERKQATENLGNDPSEVERSEDKWSKRAKNKFKEEKKAGIDPEEEEKIRGIIKGKMEEAMGGKDNNNNNKNNKMKANVKKGETMGARDEEEEGKWEKAKLGNKDMETKNDNNNNKNNKDKEEGEGQGKGKKFVEGKIRLVEGENGPEPKKIEIGGKRKGERKKTVGKGKSKRRVGRRTSALIVGAGTSTQLETDSTTLDGGLARVDELTQIEGTTETDEDEEMGGGGRQGARG